MIPPRQQRIICAVAAVALIVSVFGWIIRPDAFAAAWLSAMTAWLGWPLGCMALLLIHSLTGGRWGTAIKPQLLAGIRTLVLLPVIVPPYIIVSPRLYPWLHADVAAHLGNRFYLNPPFFAVRGVLYLTAWLGLAGVILRATARGDPIATARGDPIARFAPAGLILLAVTVTFAAIDTTMSLDPRFNSSVYGMLVATSDTLLALAISVLLAAMADGRGDLARGDLGRLLLGLAVLWAYLDFMQLLIVWQSDLTRDAPWYVERLAGEWGVLAGVVALAHFLLPFLLLLIPASRRNPRAIAGICALLIGAGILRAWWLVLPALADVSGWICVASMTGITAAAVAVAGGGWSGVALFRVRSIRD